MKTPKSITTIVALSVLVIGALLALGYVLVTPRRTAKTTVDLMLLQSASSNYFQTYSVWPKCIHDLEWDANPQKIVFIAPAPATNDAWGRPLVYVPFDSSLGYGRVFSFGRDGKPGGSGPDADIEFRFGK